MADAGFVNLLSLLVLFLPSLLTGVHAIKHDQPRIWLMVFLGAPIFGPLLYGLRPVGGASRPHR